MIVTNSNMYGTTTREVTFEPIKNCNTCKFKNNHKFNCDNCINGSSYQINVRTERKMGGLDRVVKGYRPSEAISLIARTFKVSYMEAKDYYWKWRKVYVRSKEW